MEVIPRAINTDGKWAERLQAIYAEIPEGYCQGKCVAACSSIGMTTIEAEHIKLRHQLPMADGVDGPCSKLVDGKCSIYEDRPAICRLYGATFGFSLPGGISIDCPYNCWPKDKTIPARKAVMLLKRIDSLNKEYGFPPVYVYTSGWKQSPLGVAGNVPLENLQYLDYIKSVKSGKRTW